MMSPSESYLKYQTVPWRTGLQTRIWNIIEYALTWNSMWPVTGISMQFKSHFMRIFGPRDSNCGVF